MRRSVTFRISRLVAAVAFAAALAVAVVAFGMERRAHIDGQDNRLRAAAAALPLLLPSDFHDRALRGEVTASEHAALLNSIEEHSERADVPLLYTYVLTDDGAAIAICIPTPQMRAAGESFALMTPDPTPPGAVVKAFESGEVQFSQYRSQYGAFRSCFMPLTTVDGTRYVAGADILVESLRAWVIKRLLVTLAAALLVSLVVGALGARVGRRIAQPFALLAADVDRLNLADTLTLDESALAQLQRLSASDDESGRLANALLRMRERLAGQVEALREATAERERVESELNVARSIQQALLPSSPPQLEHFEVQGWSREMELVGGDFYFWTGHDPTTVIIADVTGHGLGSAFIAATCRARAEAIIDGEPGPAAALTRLNTLMSRDLVEGRFVTLAAAMLDDRTGAASIGSAGHGPILHGSRQSGVVTEIESTGLPLGVLPEQVFDDDCSVMMSVGDVIVLVSDGVTERVNDSGDMYGTARLTGLLGELLAADATAESILDRIKEDVEAFADGRAATDDTTAVVIRRC